MSNNESLNINIIKEFEKLVNYIYNQIDINNNIKEKTANQFRLKNIKNSLSMIKKYNKELNNETINETNNSSEFSQIASIHSGSMIGILDCDAAFIHIKY